jgi:hypothetical protein
MYGKPWFGACCKQGGELLSARTLLTACTTAVAAMAQVVAIVAGGWWHQGVGYTDGDQQRHPVRVLGVTEWYVGLACSKHSNGCWGLLTWDCRTGVLCVHM